MEIVNCELCDTPIEIEVGDQRMVFTKHSNEWCRIATKQRISMLKGMLQAASVEQHLFHDARGRLAVVYREACELRQRFLEGRAGLPGVAHRDDLQPLFDAVDAARDGAAPRERTPPPPTSIPGPGVLRGG